MDNKLNLSTITDFDEFARIFTFLIDKMDVILHRFALVSIHFTCQNFRGMANWFTIKSVLSSNLYDFVINAYQKFYT